MIFFIIVSCFYNIYMKDNVIETEGPGTSLQGFNPIYILPDYSTSRQFTSFPYASVSSSVKKR